MFPSRPSDPFCLFSLFFVSVHVFQSVFFSPQTSASILVSLLFHTELRHAHSTLRFRSLWAAERGVDQNDYSNRVAARVLKQQTAFSQYNSFLLTIKYPGLIKKASSIESLSASLHIDSCLEKHSEQRLRFRLGRWDDTV